MSFWWSTFPFFWDKLTETKHIWVCVCVKHVWHSVLVSSPQPGEPNQGSQTLAQMWEVAGWGCLLSWHVALQCVCMFLCVFSAARLYPVLSGAVPPLANVPARPKEIRQELPLMFSTGFPWGKSKCFLDIKWWALRSAEVFREAKNGFLKCSWMVVRKFYFYLPCVCTEASMHDFLLFLESFKHMVNRLSMGWNLLLQEMLLQIVFPLQCIEGFSCHPQHMLWNPSGLQKEWPKVFKALWNTLGLQRKW